jgi:hypothetical protein
MVWSSGGTHCATTSRDWNTLQVILRGHLGKVHRKCDDKLKTNHKTRDEGHTSAWVNLVVGGVHEVPLQQSLLLQLHDDIRDVLGFRIVRLHWKW